MWRGSSFLPSQEEAEGFNWGDLQIIKTKRKRKYYTNKELSDHYYVDIVGELDMWYEEDFNFNDDHDSCLLYLPYDKFRFLLARYWDHADKIEELKQIALNVFPKVKLVTLHPDKLRHARLTRQAEVTISDFFEQSKMSLQEFIMDPSIVLFVDNNNLTGKMISSGIINRTFIKSIDDCYTLEKEE